jgi:hypothetical protein
MQMPARRWKALAEVAKSLLTFSAFWCIVHQIPQRWFADFRLKTRPETPEQSVSPMTRRHGRQLKPSLPPGPVSAIAKRIGSHLQPDRPHNWLAVALAGLIGFTAWGSPLPLWMQALAALLPLCWIATRARWAAGLVLAAYTAAANRGLIMGAVDFLNISILQSVGIWLAIAAVSFLLGFLCWHRDQTVRAILSPLVLILWCVPPFGLIGWHPAVAAGWLLPGWGWWGLAATLMAGTLLGWRHPLRNGALAALPLLAMSAIFSAPVTVMEGWRGHNTTDPWRSVEHNNNVARIKALYADIPALMLGDSAEVQLFPESIAQDEQNWSWAHWPAFMAEQAPEKIALVGASVIEQGLLSNVLIEFRADGHRVAYRQRVPIPAIMWTPWNDMGHTPYLNKSGTVPIAGMEAGVFLCYEGLIVWPVLQSVLASPDVFLYASSLWWAPDSIVRSQNQAMRSWSRLFGIPLVEAYNR